MRCYIVMVLAAFLSSTQALAHEAGAPRDSIRQNLCQSINQLLNLQQQIAAYKTSHHLPIDNPHREQLVLNANDEMARNQQIDEKTFHDYFIAELNLAKTLQRRWQTHWITNPPAPNAPDLYLNIRPQLIQIEQQMLEQLHQYLSSGGKFDTLTWQIYDQNVQVKMANRADKLKLYRTLQKIHLQYSANSHSIG